MALFPHQFKQSTEGSIASYDFNDIAAGVGILQMFAGALRDDSGETFLLSKDTFDPYISTDDDITGRDVRFMCQTNAELQEEVNRDFETSKLNLPRIIDGKIFVRVPVQTNRSQGSGRGLVQIVAALKRDRGGSKTTIASATSNTAKDGTSTGSTMHFAFEIDVPPTKFRVGDKIVMNLTVNARKNDGANACGVLVCHDPLDRAISSVDNGGNLAEQASKDEETATYFLLPFRIDL